MNRYKLERFEREFNVTSAQILAKKEVKWVIQFGIIKETKYYYGGVDFVFLFV